ncbi:MAG TPA: peptidoglycan bridge formation glycyltransferase FemA/FemB family protein [Candidatus Levybacteria bacterium]|nr:peptidoglycan bridge formation glycyltransferase FemA/FemB family protein [Candidatus Levybacteria bacterium]
MPELIDITEKQKDEYNKLITHPLQAYEWGEFRKKTGVTVLRKGLEKDGTVTEVFTLTIHPIPKTPYTIGYLPKGTLPTKQLLEALTILGREHNCVFIQLEPNISKTESSKSKIENLGLFPSHHPLFTRFTFVLDLSKSEEELLAQMHQKTRYNIKVATKKGVVVQEDNSTHAFKEYLRLTDETTKRQKFYAHTSSYHTLQWETLPHTAAPHTLSSHLLTATFEKETLVAWIVFICNGKLYYPYGASSSTHRDKMASNLIMWEAIKFGKKMGCTEFDMWGALGENPDLKDPWYGFHRFKQNYGAVHVEFLGSYDYILKPHLYKLYQGTDILRWAFLRLKKKIT